MSNAQKKAPEKTGATLKKITNGTYNIPLCSGFGQWHSPNNKRNPKPYDKVSIADIDSMLENPAQTDKEQAQWVIFSSLASRVHSEQLERGDFYALWADIDEPQGIGFDNAFTRIASNLQIETLAYTSSSATKAKQKARFIFPLAQAISGHDFVIMQKILNDKIEALGVKPDRVTERPGQICYLPNRGKFYLWERDPLFQCVSPDLWGNEIAAEYEAQEQEQRDRQARLEQSRQRATKRMQSGEKSPVAAYNGAYDWRDLWQQYGAKRIGKRFVSPYSESGNAAINELPDEPGKWVSHHGSDIAHGVGKVSADGSTCFGDAFDLFVHFEHGGDYDAALAKAGAMFTDNNGKSITKQNQQAYAEQQAVKQAGAMFESEEEPEQPEETSHADVDLLSPPGLCGDICELMGEKARRARPELYPLAALHLMALVGRKRTSVYTEKLNLITLAIAPTAAGKETAQGVTKELARGVQCSRLIHGDIGSFKEVILNLLDGDGSNLYIVDEIHSLLGAMKNDKAATYETRIEKEMLTMTTTELYTFRGMEKRPLMEAFGKSIAQIEAKLEKLSEDNEDERRKLERALAKYQQKLEYLENGWPNPFFSLMGHSVPERLDSFTNAESIASGFIGRSLIMRCPETREKLRRGQPNSVKVASLMGAIQYGLESILGQYGVIGATDEAAEYLDQCVDWFDEDEQLNHPIVGGIYARAPEQLYKVASILGLDGGTITLDHARYAHALVKNSVADISYLMLKAYADSLEATEKTIMASAKQTVLRNCKGQGRTPSAVKQMIQKPKGFQLMQEKNTKRDYAEELIQQLLQSGELVLHEDNRRKRLVSKAII